MKISVKNLPLDITEDALKTVFAQVGEVQSVSIRSEMLTMQPRKYGVIDLALEVDAYRAINCFEGATFKGQQVRVREAYPLFERARITFEHMTDGRALPYFKLVSGLERWKKQFGGH